MAKNYDVPDTRAGKVISNDGNTAIVRYPNGDKLSIERQKPLMNEKDFLRLLYIRCSVGGSSSVRSKKIKSK